MKTATILMNRNIALDSVQSETNLNYFWKCRFEVFIGLWQLLYDKAFKMRQIILE